MRELHDRRRVQGMEPATGLTGETKSGETGQHRFVLLDPGVYSMSVNADRFAENRFQDFATLTPTVQVESQRNTLLCPTLRVGCSPCAYVILSLGSVLDRQLLSFQEAFVMSGHSKWATIKHKKAATDAFSEPSL